MNLMTHDQLVERAVRWLKNSAVVWCDYTKTNKMKKRCTVVAAELCSSISEQPDAIGWCDGGNSSILIECKASRSDFLRDKKKFFRHHSHMGVGDYRYMFAEQGLLEPELMPVDWGLLEVKGRQVIVTKIAKNQKKNVRNEVKMLFSICRRYQIEEGNR